MQFAIIIRSDLPSNGNRPNKAKKTHPSQVRFIFYFSECVLQAEACADFPA